MCGIVGYIGNQDVAPVLLDGLEKLEYRGYDSAGISALENGEITTIKTKGKISELRKKVKLEYNGGANIGIGHTRWATHGKPSDVNSHPHISFDGKFSVVHNGIIENFVTLRQDLKNEGIRFLSDTDTEVVAQLLAKYYNGDMKATILKVLSKIEGAYSLGILCADYPDEIWAVRNASPLIIGLGKTENFLASDITAVLKYTKEIYQLNDGEFCCLKKNSVQVFNPQGEPIEKEVVKITWNVEADNGRAGGNQKDNLSPLER